MISARLLAAFARAYPTATFVEIGANDGEFLDPLQPYLQSLEWTGVMVEPVPHVCERLRRNYADNDLIEIEQAAVAATDGTQPFYYVREQEAEDAEGLPWWRDAIGSFDREHVVAHLGGAADPGRQIAEAEVRCLSFESLCRQHGIERVDLILIDAEGADAEIVGSIALDRWRPRLLIYEHQHLEPSERARCERRLELAGYELVADGIDTWCLDVRAEDPLTQDWNRILRPLAEGRR